MSSLRESYWKIANLKGNIYFRPVTDNGLITGNKNMNVNGSATPVEFIAKPDNGQIMTLLQLSLSISDGGSPAGTDYGSISGPLINGVKFFTEIQGVRRFFDTVLNQNSDISEAGDRFDNITLSGGVRILTYYADYYNYSEGITLTSETNDLFGVQINDNLTALLTHGVQVKGFTRLSKGV